MESSFNYHFCVSNLILQWVIFKLLLFLLGRKRCIYPVFPDFSFRFLRQYWLLEMKQLESWVHLKIENLECQMFFAIFVHVAGFFAQSSQLHIVVTAVEIRKYFVAGCFKVNGK